MRALIAIPVYNEEDHLERVLAEVVKYSPEVLAIDDGSTDRSPAILDAHPFVEVHRHETNEGYGRSLIDAFRIAACRGFDWVVTLDADEQHDPATIAVFLEGARRCDCDIFSGSRYLPESLRESPVPEERRSINVLITQVLNRVTPYELTDAFCGFKAYRVEAVAALGIAETGYAMPLELWIKAARAGLEVREVPIKLVYVDPRRTFGRGLDDPRVRLRHYLAVLDRELAAWREEARSGDAASDALGAPGTASTSVPGAAGAEPRGVGCGCARAEGGP